MPDPVGLYDASTKVFACMETNIYVHFSWQYSRSNIISCEHSWKKTDFLEQSFIAQGTLTETLSSNHRQWYSGPLFHHSPTAPLRYSLGAVHSINSMPTRVLVWAIKPSNTIDSDGLAPVFTFGQGICPDRAPPVRIWLEGPISTPGRKCSIFFLSQDVPNIQGVTAISPTLKSTNFLQNEHLSIWLFCSIMESLTIFECSKIFSLRRKPLQQRFGILGFFSVLVWMWVPTGSRFQSITQQLIQLYFSLNFQTKTKCYFSCL